LVAALKKAETRTGAAAGRESLGAGKESREQGAPLGCVGKAGGREKKPGAAGSANLYRAIALRGTMASIAGQLTENPFKSVMTMLYNNKCWLCEGVFARGKVKKVFMVSHLLRFLKEHHSQSRDAALQSKHLRECFDEYCRLEGNEEQV
jgi:hypothetical protein